MEVANLNQEFQGMDISLLDQVLKGRFVPGSKVLDVGFGSGRNLFWFFKNYFQVFGLEKNEDAVIRMKNAVSHLSGNPNNFIVGQLEELTYENDSFDLVICNAVLHFAESEEHFKQMFSELVRVLCSTGILFIRMTSNIGIEDKLDSSKNGVHLIPDGSYRFLLTREMLGSLLSEFHLKLIEVLKTVNVNDQRCMSTLVLKKDIAS